MPKYTQAKPLVVRSSRNKPRMEVKLESFFRGDSRDLRMHLAFTPNGYDRRFRLTEKTMSEATAQKAKALLRALHDEMEATLTDEGFSSEVDQADSE